MEAKEVFDEGAGRILERSTADDQGLAVAADVPPTAQKLPFSIDILLT